MPKRESVTNNRKPYISSMMITKKRIGKYADCNGLEGYGDFITGCRILTEMFCITRGNCKFYKAKE